MLFLDNVAAVLAITGGSSSRPDMLRIVAMFHAVLNSMGADLWVEHVPGVDNITDIP